MITAAASALENLVLPLSTRNNHRDIEVLARKIFPDNEGGQSLCANRFSTLLSAYTLHHAQKRAAEIVPGEVPDGRPKCDRPQVLLANFLEEGFFPATVVDTLQDSLLHLGIPQQLVEQEVEYRVESLLGQKIRTERYPSYCARKGLQQNSGIYHFYLDHYYQIEQIKAEYDVGIGIAQGGLYLSYLFSLAGLPVMTVTMKRKGKGASFQPSADFDGSELKDKRVLLIDDDVHTGRTLQRAVREIELYKPQELGACFIHESARDFLSQVPSEISASYVLSSIAAVPYDWVIEKTKQFLPQLS